MPFPLFRKTPKTFSDIVFFTYFARETRISNINQIQLIMKKILLIAAMVLGFAVAATAQTRTMGARFGGGTFLGADFSYQHSMGDDFIEANVGATFDVISLSVTGIYNFMISQPKWTSQGTWGIYAGPGAHIGGILSTMTFNLVGQVGIEYFFEDLPLQLSLDLRPFVGYQAGGDTVEGGLAINAAAGLGVRYCF